MTPFLRLVQSLHDAEIRFVLIGIAGANYFALDASTVFTTQDRDLFLPPDPRNLLGAWEACAGLGLDLTASGQPLDRPRDLWLAERVVERRALTRASDGGNLLVDLTLTMAGFGFDEVWRERRNFESQGVQIPVARLRHIVESKAAAGREKDRLFLATHAEALRELLGESFPWERDST